MIQFRKENERNFSVSQATKSLRRVSPTLISLILRRERKMTIDRVDELAKLIKLNSTEKVAFRNWIASQYPPEEKPKGDFQTRAAQTPNRKDVSTSILNDWVNVYVKDFFQLEAIRKNPALLKNQLNTVNPKRIQRAIDFLVKEGHLRRTLDGSLTLETNLAVADPKATSKKIREFHKSALTLARQAIDLYPPQDRFANTLTLPLDEPAYAEFMEIIHEFMEKLKDFASQREQSEDHSSERLYQFILNLSPIGEKLEGEISATPKASAGTAKKIKGMVS